MSDPIITKTPITVPNLSEYPDTSPLWGLNPFIFVESYEGVLCAKCLENYSYIDNMFVNGQTTEEAWCPKCLLDRFNEARARYEHASCYECTCPNITQPSTVSKMCPSDNDPAALPLASLPGLPEELCLAVI